jgi:CRISPR-associated protein Csd1
MLQLLVEYVKNRKIPVEPGFTRKRARWAICFDGEGRFLDVVELGDTTSKRNRGLRFPKCPDLSQGELVAGKEKRSHFLVDTADVVALYGKKSEDSTVRAKHAFFVKLLKEAGKEIQDLSKLAESMGNSGTLREIRSRLETSKAKATDKVTFNIGNHYPLESNSWHQWWRVFRSNLVEKVTTSSSTDGQHTNSDNKIEEKMKSARPMRCYGTGELIEPVRTHPQIEGLADVGGKSRTALVGFDKESFCSFGLKQSANAAVSEDAAAAYRAALNDLLEESSIRLAGAKVVYWFKEDVPQEDDPYPWLEESEEQQERNALSLAKELLDSIKAGRRVDLATNFYYAITLSGAKGRVMVRDWMEGQFEELVTNLCSWFNDLEIVNFSGSKQANLPGIERVVTCLLPLRKSSQAYDDWVKPIGSERIGLWRAALKGTPISHNIVSRVTLLDINFRLNGELENAIDSRDKRLFASTVSLLHARMGLVKAYHLRKSRKTGGGSMTPDLKPHLTEDHPEPAYHCGRLIAVLARLQRAALGNVGAGIIQRYYAAASSTPALVLGRLTRSSQYHISKLEPGLAYWYDGRIAGIWGQIKDSIPTTLTLEKQSLFALGYYQQMAAMWSKKSDNTEDLEEESNE